MFAVQRTNCTKCLNKARPGFGQGIGRGQLGIFDQCSPVRDCTFRGQDGMASHTSGTKPASCKTHYKHGQSECHNFPVTICNLGYHVRVKLEKTNARKKDLIQVKISSPYSLPFQWKRAHRTVSASKKYKTKMAAVLKVASGSQTRGQASSQEP